VSVRMAQAPISSIHFAAGRPTRAPQVSRSVCMKSLYREDRTGCTVVRSNLALLLPERKTLRILVVFRDNIPDDQKASSQTVATELLSKASTLLDEHNLELDHAADPTPFFHWNSRMLDGTALDSLETDMDDIQNALLPIRRGAETSNRLPVVFAKFRHADNPTLAGDFRGMAYVKPSTRQNRLLESVVFINIDTVPGATDRAMLVHEMLHCCGCNHIPPASAADVARGAPQDVMAVLGGSAANRTGMNMWQVQALMKFAGVPWVFDPNWTATDRGWR
jgi:hypothetical protein